MKPAREAPISGRRSATAPLLHCRPVAPASAGPSIPTALARLREVLRGRGIAAALQYIAERSGHRFIGVYHFDDTMLRTQFFHDRDHPDAGPPADIPVMSSYCVFVRDSGLGFIVEDAPHDRRVDGHAKQSQLLSYCGVPMLDEHGDMFGTACLYDLVPRDVSALDLALLEALGPLISEHSRRSTSAPHR